MVESLKGHRAEGAGIDKTQTEPVVSEAISKQSATNSDVVIEANLSLIHI